MTRKAAAPKTAAKKEEAKEEVKEAPKVKKDVNLEDQTFYSVEGTGKSKHIKKGQKLDIAGLQAKTLLKQGAITLK